VSGATVGELAAVGAAIPQRVRGAGGLAETTSAVPYNTAS